MEYQYIVNPTTNRRCRIDTALGKRIIKNYKKTLIGGSDEPNPNMTFEDSLAQLGSLLDRLDRQKDERRAAMTPQERNADIAREERERADRMSRGLGPDPMPTFMFNRMSENDKARLPRWMLEMQYEQMQREQQEGQAGMGGARNNRKTRKTRQNFRGGAGDNCRARNFTECGIQWPTDTKKTRTKRGSIQLHPDKNSGCSETAANKLKFFNNITKEFCNGESTQTCRPSRAYLCPEEENTWLHPDEYDEALEQEGYNEPADLVTPPTSREDAASATAAAKYEERKKEGWGAWAARKLGRR